MIEQIPAHLLPERNPGPYPAGRTCSHARCQTVLNRNNPGPRCEAHKLAAMPEVELIAETLDRIEQYPPAA